MDGWQAAQNWLIFAAIVAGAVYYYYPQAVTTTSAAASRVAKPAVQITNKITPNPKSSGAKSSGAKRTQSDAPKKAATSSKDTANKSSPPRQKGNKATVEVAPVQDHTAVEEPQDKGLEDSNRAFAQSMIKARQGVDVKKAQNTNERVKTVKAKDAAIEPQAFASATSVADLDEGDWSQVTSSQLKASGVEDMLEAPAPGPTSLRITPSQKPIKEKATAKQPKQDTAETKKQRQNRQKVEQQRLQREEEERARKALEERQRRSAREARGEPAKNGLAASAPPPKNSAWSASASHSAQSPPDAQSYPAPQLLDTFDAESTSSSTDAPNSTAATSTTDGATAQWSDEPFQPEDLTKSMVETGPWNEVKKKQKKRKGTPAQDANGSTTPVPAAANTNITQPAKASGGLSSQKPSGFAALKDELVDPNDASNW